MKTKLSAILPVLAVLIGAIACQGAPPTATPSPSSPPATTTPIPSLTPTSTISYTQCIWNWATQPLPALSEDLESDLQTALHLPLTAYAEAFGENCFDGRTNQVAYFAAMETDFYVTVQVEALADREALGQAMEQILTVILSHFPVEATPGPRPGYITITFVADTEQLRLRLTWPEAESTLVRGLHGASLLDELENR